MRKFVIAGLLLLGMQSAMVLAEEEKTAAPKPPDLTRGDKPDNKHRWTLGATGARGWVWSRNVGGGSENTDARQILITDIAKGSPADGVLKPGDVVTGLNGKPFDSDARRLFAQAVTEAEKDANNGVLKLVRWRAGKTENVELKLQVLGTYAPTAPYDCAKSKRIFEQGCASIARQGLKDEDGNIEVSIENDMNALALLALVASGRKEYGDLVARYAERVAGYRPEPGELTSSWEYAYNTLFLAEYALATGDKNVMPGLKRLSLEIARGISAVGTWGHGFAQPGGNLGGYGCMNQTGIPLTLAMVLAREAGVKEPDLDRSIAKASGFLRQWVNQGAIPYGDHEAWSGHDDNGKCSGAAVLFDLLGDRAAATFYSRMGTAAYSERESGHCGNYFNILWALPGVSRCGPAATAAYFKETSWYYDLARGWDGRVDFVGFPGEDSFEGWDCTGSYLLGYALPLKSLYITGRKQSVIPELTQAEIDDTIAAGRDFTFQAAEENDWYSERKPETLLAGLSSWSPAVRKRSSQALGRREGNFLPRILELLNSPDRNSRYGACEALAVLGPKADPAAPQVRALLADKDPWLRRLAARTLPCMGAKVRLAAIPDLLRAATLTDDADPRKRLTGEVAKALFAPMPGTDEPEPILSESLDGVDRKLLHAAIKQALANEDGLVRGLVAPIYPMLSKEDIEALLPEIITAVRVQAPSGEMFSDDIRLAGLKLLADHHYEAGIKLGADYAKTQNSWDSQERTPVIMEEILKYGKAARVVLPEMKALIQQFDAECKAGLFPDDCNRKRVVSVKKTIKAIQAATTQPKLIPASTGPGR